MKNILVVNVNWMGDIIFSSPIFKALKDKYPQSHVVCMAPPRVKQILESIEGVDEIIEYDEEKKHRSIFSKIGLIIKLSQKKFDSAFLLHRSKTKALLVYLAGIKNRIGYDTKGRSKFLTQSFAEPKNKIHRSDYYLKIIEDYGITIKDRSCRLKVAEDVQSSVDQILKSNGLTKQNYILIHPGGNWDLKRWPANNYSLLVKQLQNDKKIKVVITGTDHEMDLANKISEGLMVKPVVLTGKLTLKELMLLMQNAKLVISGDSGPIHIASCVGTESVGLFGPTRPEITSPRGVGKTTILQKDVGCNKQACYHLDCPSNICMQVITVEDVLHAIK